MYLTDPGLPTIRDLIKVYRNQCNTSNDRDPIMLPCFRVRELLDEIERGWAELEKLKAKPEEKRGPGRPAKDGK